ncbi:MAG TPA: hypothetical protein VII06_16610 [Chloroflexota bacterium]|jgi:hypothetical protein
MRRLMVVLALGATLLGAGVPAASAQLDPYGGMGYGGYGAYGGYGGYSGYGTGAPAYGGYTGAPYAPGGAVGPLAIPGPYPVGPYGSGGYGYPQGYGGVPYGNWPYYAGPTLSGIYNATGSPTFGLFPYLAQNGNFANPSPYQYNQPYAFFMGCTSTYTASNFYVCR